MTRRFSLAYPVATAAAVLIAALPPACGEGEEDIRELKLKDWQPRSMLVTKVTEVLKPAFPVIDAHNHLGGYRDVKKCLEEMDAAGVRVVVNLDGGRTLESLKGALEKWDEAYPGRFLTFVLLDWQGIDEPDWSRREVEKLAKAFMMGAKGLKIHKTLGLWVRRKDGTLLGVDDPILDPIWETCAKFKRPVVIHTADPAAFFTPLDRFNERWHELNANPGWLFFGEKYPERNDLLAQRNRMIERHPKTTFLTAHLGNNPEDLGTVSQWLDRYPNMIVDIDARISELGRQPYTARRFFIKYQDRITFGTDTPPRRDAYRTYYRFLETDDESFDCAVGHHFQGFWMIYGVYLPREVLEKVYYKNAMRLLHGVDREVLLGGGEK
jgi:predicted TIM-barrel fold metal-dependent hydrolase